MAKEVKNQVESEIVENSFIDKSDKKWLINKKENKVTLCESIAEIISGNAETYDFSRKIDLFRKYSKNGKEIVKNNFIVFHLTTGESILVKRWNEMR